MAECKVCGAIASEGSVYCQKCGKKLDEAGISAGKLSAFLQEQMEMSGTVETQQYCRALMEKVGELKFQEVEIHRSSLEGLNLTNLIYEEDGRLHIICQEPEDFLKLAGALLINELDCMRTELNEISQGLHNDRMAEVLAAYEMYKRAMLTTGDAARKTVQLDNASNSCIKGREKIKKEMRQNLDLFQCYPKNPVAKIFCGIKPQTAEQAYNQMKEAFPFYCDAVRTQMCIDLQNKEMEKLNMTVAEERDFLRQIRDCKGYQRLQEVVEVDAEKWDGYIDSLKADMYLAEKLISEGAITVKILEEKK